MCAKTMRSTRSSIRGGRGVGAAAAVFHGELYFAARVPGMGEELWKTNGTPEGTALVRDLAPGEEGSAPAGLTWSRTSCPGLRAPIRSASRS